MALNKYAFAGANLHSKGTQGSAEAPHALGSLPNLEIDMKKLLAIAVLTLATVPAMAQHYHHGYRTQHHHHHYRGPNWGPIIGGAVLGAVIYDIYNRPVVVQQPPVVVQQPPIVVQQYPQPVQNCSPWTETQNPDGSITRTRTCAQ